MRKRILHSLFGLFLLPSAAFADCGEVTITEMNWASAAVVTHISKFFMEQGYGCKVTTVTSSNVPALTSLAETGQPEIVTELWTNAIPAYETLSAAKKIVTVADVLSDGGVEGLWVPTYLVEKHPELATIEGVLANPKLVGGRIHNCPDGWGCKNIIESLFQALNMQEKGMELFQHGSSETLATSIASAFEDKGPWIGYYWAPTAILGQYPMTKVSIGKFDSDVHSCNVDPECQKVGISDWPAAPVKTVVSTEFSSKNPEVSAFMSKVSFTNEQMNSLLAWREENSASAEETAVHFLTTRKDVWSSWVNDSAKSKLSALIQ